MCVTVFVRFRVCVYVCNSGKVQIFAQRVSAPPVFVRHCCVRSVHNTQPLNIVLGRAKAICRRAESCTTQSTCTPIHAQVVGSSIVLDEWMYVDGVCCVGRPRSAGECNGNHVYFFSCQRHTFSQCAGWYTVRSECSCVQVCLGCAVLKQSRMFARIVVRIAFAAELCPNYAVV